jgi:hypothetical protein
MTASEILRLWREGETWLRPADFSLRRNKGIFGSEIATWLVNYSINNSYRVPAIVVYLL